MFSKKGTNSSGYSSQTVHCVELVIKNFIVLWEATKTTAAKDVKLESSTSCTLYVVYLGPCNSVQWRGHICTVRALQPHSIPWAQHKLGSNQRTGCKISFFFDDPEVIALPRRVSYRHLPHGTMSEQNHCLTTSPSWWGLKNSLPPLPGKTLKALCYVTLRFPEQS